MPNPGTGNMEQHTPTHPDLEAQFELLATPDVELSVKAAQSPKEGPVNDHCPHNQRGTIWARSIALISVNCWQMLNL